MEVWREKSEEEAEGKNDQNIFGMTKELIKVLDSKSINFLGKYLL